MTDQGNPDMNTPREDESSQTGDQGQGQGGGMGTGDQDQGQGGGMGTGEQRQGQG